MKDNFTNINHNLKKHLELSFEIPKKVTNTTYLFFLRIRIPQDHQVSTLGEVLQLDDRDVESCYSTA